MSLYYVSNKKNMAKKDTKKDYQEDINNVETVCTNDTEITIARISNNVSKDMIGNMSLIDLVYAEKCAKTVCQRYENSIKNYDGSIAHNSIEYKKFQRFNDIHQCILNKMEEKLLQL